MKDYELLDWDTSLFGFPVARIVPAKLNAVALGDILAELRRKAVLLAYWASDDDSAESAAAALSLRGRLVDRKATYVIDLDIVEQVVSVDSGPVEQFHGDKANDRMEALAIQSGERSRFNCDPRVPRARFEQLYRTWIQRSVKKEIADAVLVIYDEDLELAGMVTVGEKNGRGDIGLIAVDAAARNKGYGRLLVQAAVDFFRTRGYRVAQVVTQADNKPACRLYEKSGFRLEHCQNFFHFWLD